jgi:hypothetical protein
MPSSSSVPSNNIAQGNMQNTKSVKFYKTVSYKVVVILESLLSIEQQQMEILEQLRIISLHLEIGQSQKPSRRLFPKQAVPLLQSVLQSALKEIIKKAG